MKLYTARGPNPRVVTMFMAEKGLELDKSVLDNATGESRRMPFVALNPAGQTPALQLDDGTIVAESTVICEYLEELHPDPPLIGRDAEQRAATRMWTRRIDFKVSEPMTNGFRAAEGLKVFESRMRCLPEAASGLKATARDGLEWLESNFQGPWIAGERFSLADIVLFAFVEFGNRVGQPLPPELVQLTEWYGRVSARPSVAASAMPPPAPAPAA